MNHYIVLNIGIVANPDIVYIAPEHCSIPDAAVISGNHITNYNRSFGQKAILSKFRSFT
jgi:hypothetical protein